jgi:hypothetical protein
MDAMAATSSDAASHLHQRRGAGSAGSSSSGVSGGPTAAAGAGAGSSGGSVGDDSRFECNVCLDSPDEPVVTLCGHLFWWVLGLWRDRGGCSMDDVPHTHTHTLRVICVRLH